MSAVDFAIDAAGVLSFGDYSDTPAGGHNTRLFNGGGVVGFDFIGTQCEVQIYQQGDFRVEIDGAAATITPGGSGSFAWISVATGLSDAPHVARVYVLNYIDTDASIRVTGASPSVAQSADLGAQIKYNAASVPDYIRFDGYAFNGTGAGVSCKQGLIGFELTFRARITHLRGFMYGLGPTQPFRLAIDGVDQASVIEPPVSAWGLQDLATGLDGAAVHTYSLRGIGASYFFSLILGGVGLSTAAVIPSRDQQAVIGDSISAAFGATPQFDFTTYWPGMVGRGGNFGIASAAVSGQLLVDNGLAQVDALIASLPVAPAHLLIQFGHNDVAAGKTTAEFKTAYKAVIAAAVAAWPSCIVCGERIFIDEVGDGDRATYAPYDTATQAAVSEASNANVVYVDTSTWYDGVSGTHPSTADSAAQIAPAILTFLGVSPAPSGNALLGQNISPSSQTIIGRFRR